MIKDRSEVLLKQDCVVSLRKRSVGAITVAIQPRFQLMNGASDEGNSLVRLFVLLQVVTIWG